MKYYFHFSSSILISFLLTFNYLSAQSPGDTIVVQVFDHNSTARDTLVQFPDKTIGFEKIIMRYNMRCKGGLVSTGADRNKGCGEWDYSCNTYIVDSTKVEEVTSIHSNFIISNFEEDIFPYVSEPIYDFYLYHLEDIKIKSIISEESSVIGFGDMVSDSGMDGSQSSGKTQVLYLASELINAGFSSGKIDGLKLYVENSEGQLSFLNVKIKSVYKQLLVPNSPEKSGFTSVYYGNYHFEEGENRIQFSSVYDWDGMSDLLIEYSFSNTTSKDNIRLKGSITAQSMMIYTNNNYAVDFSKNGYVDIDPSNFESIDKELTISFWTYGDSELQPQNNSIVWANSEDKTQRELNIHLPWGNGNIYFDCGFDGGYDRLNKLSNSNDYKDKWNHWAFTKNAITGIMKIYVNGKLFANSTGNKKSMKFLEMILGMDHRHLNNYKGKINEFRVWDKALLKEDINDWMNIPIDDSHPYYDNLVAYYPMQEGINNIINDTKNNKSSKGENLFLSSERGNTLDRGFRVSSIRPQISLLRGEYDLDISFIDVMDSIQRDPNIINAYVIQSNSGSVKHDEIVLDSSFTLYHTIPSNVFDGETGEILNTIPVASEGELVIKDLDYTSRYPFYNEILSFVTPYGIGLNLGKNGKSWFFDVTDFAPILHGEKGLKITQGGERQEELDVSFLFIVGIPPRDIIAFDQIWQGATRLGAPNIYDLFEEKKINPVDINIHPDGKYFKIKSTITGHGSDGEFQQNGGAVLHALNIGGDDPEVYWTTHKECSENPIYPQGGTWVIDRQGWCPGERSLLSEFDVTEYITAGTTTSIDYEISKAKKDGGDYKYLMAHQLITYGDANKMLDAAISDVLVPSNNVLYSRFNPSCVNPSVVLQNTGSTTLSSVEIKYWVNDGIEETYLWSGNLEFMEYTTVDLPSTNVFVGANNGSNMFHVLIEKPNNTTDEYEFNNQYNSAFILADNLPDEFVIEIKTNARPFENSYNIVDHDGKIVFSNGLQGANTLHKDTIRLNGCYTMELRDTGNDGLEWWANSGQGKGFARIKNMNGIILKTINPDFGGKVSYGFSTQTVSLVKDENSVFGELQIIPNPSTGKFVVEGNYLDRINIELFDMFGKKYAVQTNRYERFIDFDATSLMSGMYILVFKTKNSITSKKIVIE